MSTFKVYRGQDVEGDEYEYQVLPEVVDTKMIEAKKRLKAKREAQEEEYMEWRREEEFNNKWGFFMVGGFLAMVIINLMKWGHI